MSNTITKNQQVSMTPQAALAQLIAGNQRFMQAKMQNRDLRSQANATATNQHPYAVILSCMDSRTPPEIIFDQGIADIFSIRIAGNIANSDIIGSLEFATKIVGAKLIAVIGHTNCGAIAGACQGVELGFLTALLKKIEPAIAHCKQQNKKIELTEEYLQTVTAEHAKRTAQEIQTTSAILDELVIAGELKIASGIHDLATGEVRFF